MPSETTCPFCVIAQGALPAGTVHETGHVVAFLDRRPINPGHVLVIPRQHVPSFYALEEGAYTELMLAVRQIALGIERAYTPRKVGMLAAGFDVAHAHVHVLPMYDYHDITSRALLEGTRGAPSQQEMEREASRIGQHLRASATNPGVAQRDSMSSSGGNT